MLIEVEFNETSVNTISNDSFGVLYSSRPQSVNNPAVADYNSIVNARIDELLEKKPSYLKEQEEKREDNILLLRTKEADYLLVKKFVEEMLSLQEGNNQDDCMYRVYEQMSIWSMNHKIECCDYLLDFIKVELFDIHILLSLLMATFPMRKRLTYRRSFFTRVKDHARQRYSEEKMNELFVGLE